MKATGWESPCEPTFCYLLQQDTDCGHGEVVELLDKMSVAARQIPLKGLPAHALALVETLVEYAQRAEAILADDEQEAA